MCGRRAKRIYTHLVNEIESRYTRLRCLRDTPKGHVELLRHNGSGQQYIYKNHPGSAEVYRRLAGISCPYLPRVLDVAEADGRVAVLEEYISGMSLAEMLEGALFSPREANIILRQICRGLWVLHGMNIVHRDIKPENIILSRDRAVLVDFDASRIHTPDSCKDTRVLGTIGYASPEQYGLSQTDARSDIYALGVLLNVMLTGKLPTETLVRGHLGRVVQRCTMLAPEKRYKSILHLMESL